MWMSHSTYLRISIHKGMYLTSTQMFPRLDTCMMCCTYSCLQCSDFLMGPLNRLTESIDQTNYCCLGLLMHKPVIIHDFLNLTTLLRTILCYSVWVPSYILNYKYMFSHVCQNLLIIHSYIHFISYILVQ